MRWVWTSLGSVGFKFGADLDTDYQKLTSRLHNDAIGMHQGMYPNMSRYVQVWRHAEGYAHVWIHLGMHCSIWTRIDACGSDFQKSAVSAKAPGITFQDGGRPLKQKLAW